MSMSILFGNSRSDIPGILMPGSLLKLQGPGLVDKFFFLGHSMKRPRVHVLIEGIRDQAKSDELCIQLLRPGSLDPNMCTSQSMFQRILEVHGLCPSTASIPFVVHTYSVRAFEPLTWVTVTATSEEYCFCQPKSRRSLNTKADWLLA